MNNGRINPVQALVDAMNEAGRVGRSKTQMTLGKLIEVKHRLPLGLRVLVFLHGGAAPHAAYVVAVLPEVVVPVAALLHAWNALA